MTKGNCLLVFEQSIYFMRLKDFDYFLPKNLIAQQPISPRDHSRLLVLRRRRATNSAQANKNRKTTQITDRYFFDIVDYLNN